jgi:hypothetical protein
MHNNNQRVEWRFVFCFLGVFWVAEWLCKLAQVACEEVLWVLNGGMLVASVSCFVERFFLF